MIIKIGYDNWHIECRVDSVDDLIIATKKAWVEHASEFGIGTQNPMQLATWSGKGWWAVPPDHWSAQNIGNVKIVYPNKKNDFSEIWGQLENSLRFGQQFNGLVDFVSIDEVKTPIFRVVKND